MHSENPALNFRKSLSPSGCARGQDCFGSKICLVLKSKTGDILPLSHPVVTTPFLHQARVEGVLGLEPGGPEAVGARSRGARN